MKKNLPQRVDHRNYEAQGVEKIPTKHIGVSASAIERKGKRTNQGEENRAIKKANAEIEILKTQIQQTQKEIISIREDIATTDKKEAVKINDTLYSEYIKEYPEVNAQKLRNILHEEAEKGNVYFIAKVDGQFRERIVTLEQYRQMEKELQQRTEATPKPAEPTRPQPESQPPAQKETVKEKEPPRMAQEPSQPTADRERVAFDTSGVARQLAELQNKYVRETVKSQERTEQPPQADYTKDISEIKDLTRTISDFDRSLEAMKKEHDSLGRFGHGKEKKKLKEDIADFTERREGKLELLKAYGISDPSKADEVISEKTRLAAAERYKAQAAKLNEGAGSKTAEAKAALFELAKTVPADQQQAVRSQMVKHIDDNPQDWAHKKAEIEVRKLLDEAFKGRTESREQEQIKTQVITHDR